MQVLKQEAEELGYRGKEVEEQALDGGQLGEISVLRRCKHKQTLSWRRSKQKGKEEKKRADEIRMAEIQAEADAQRLQAEEKKRAEENQIQIQIQMAQINAARE